MNSITTPQATAGYHVRDHTPSQHNLEGLRLPNFIIGGAIKGGTTSLNYYLKPVSYTHLDVYKRQLLDSLIR